MTTPTTKRGRGFASRWHLWGTAAAIGLGLLVAAVFTWFVWVGPNNAAETLSFFALSPRPQFLLADAQDRELQERLQLSAEDMLRVTLRPQKRLPGDVVVEVYLRGADEQLQRWAVPVDRTREGSFQIRQRVRDLPLIHSGSWDIFFVIGYRGKTPSAERLAGLTTGSHTGGSWLLLHQQLEIRD